MILSATVEFACADRSTTSSCQAPVVYDCLYASAPFTVMRNVTPSVHAAPSWIPTENWNLPLAPTGTEYSTNDSPPTCALNGGWMKTACRLRPPTADVV